MIKRMREREREDDRVSAYAIEQEEEEDDDKIRYCESCKDNGYLVRLKKRLYFKIDKTGKQEATEPDSDAENFRQCWRCGEIVKVKDAKIEGSLSDVIEINTDSSVKDSIQVLFPRKGKKGSLAKLRDANSRKMIKDEDAISAIKKGEHVNNYQEYQLDRNECF